MREQLGTPGLMLSIPRVPLAEQVPRSVRPNPELAPAVTVGWLLDGVAADRVPDPGLIPPLTRANVNFRLSFLQSRRPAERSGCRTLREPVTRTVTKGQGFRIDGGPIRVTPPGNRFIGVTYAPTDGHRIVAVRGPLTVSMSSVDSSKGLAVLCG